MNRKLSGFLASCPLCPVLSLRCRVMGRIGMPSSPASTRAITFHPVACSRDARCISGVERSLRQSYVALHIGQAACRANARSLGQYALRRFRDVQVVHLLGSGAFSRADNCAWPNQYMMRKAESHLLHCGYPQNDVIPLYQNTQGRLSNACVPAVHARSVARVPFTASTAPRAISQPRATAHRRTAAEAPRARSATPQKTPAVNNPPTQFR